LQSTQLTTRRWKRAPAKSFLTSDDRLVRASKCNALELSTRSVLCWVREGEHCDGCKLSQRQHTCNRKISTATTTTTYCIFSAFNQRSDLLWRDQDMANTNCY
jgi:hypothetical protein